MNIGDKITYRDLSLSKNYIGNYVGEITEMLGFYYCKVNWSQPNIVKNCREYLPNLEIIK